MKKVNGVLLMTAVLLLALAPLALADENTLPADEIIRKANHAALYMGLDSKGKVKMVIQDKQGRKRERELNMLRKDVGDGDGDQKYFVYFQAPADVRKMIFMVHKHAEPGKEDDRWLYMPSLDLVKRIAGGDKRTSFAGSDFLYEDISGRNVEADVHELIQTTDAHYVIKNTPKNPDDVEFGYYDAYLDKTTFLPMKMEYFRKDGRPYRVIKTTKVKEIEAEEDGKKVVYPTVVESVAEDMESGSKTVMTFSNIRYNIGIKDSIFSERYLRRPPREAMR